MTKSRTGAVERQCGGVCSSVKGVCGSVRGSVQCVCSNSMPIRLQWRRHILQDDHRPCFSLPLSMGMASRR